jgi:hypothetical protein
MRNFEIGRYILVKKENGRFLKESLVCLGKPAKTSFTPTPAGIGVKE